MKQEFLNFVNSLMEANPELTRKLMTDEIRQYLKALEEIKDEKPTLTKTGVIVLRTMQINSDVKMWKSKDLAEYSGISSKSVSGTMRKLVNDGFCEKMGTGPVIYYLTEKGKNYEIIEGENE